MKNRPQLLIFLPLVFLLGSLLVLPSPDIQWNNLEENSSASIGKSIAFRSEPFFEENWGQAYPAADYICRDQSTILFLKPTGLIANLPDSLGASRYNPICMELSGSDPAACSKGTGLQKSKSNYFIGNETEQWISNIPHYKQVEYEEVYSGIDLVYYFNNKLLEFDFIVKPGADPDLIGFSFPGAAQCEIDSHGNLQVSANGHDLLYKQPAAWQDLKTGRKTVNVNFAMLEDNKIVFKLGPYHKDETLIIDPKVVYATYLGGSYYDSGKGIAVDAEGCAYVTGSTGSVDFPVANAFQPEKGILSSSSGMDAFVSKFSADGSELIYSTYIGGWGDDNPEAIAVDHFGYASIAGRTGSSNRSGTPEDDGLPLKNAYQNELGGTVNKLDAFVTVLNENGSALVYSTFLGGKYDDEAADIVVDGTGALYLAGTTFSFDFPNKNAFAENIASYHFDAFATKLDPSKSGEESLIYSTFIGGTLDDYGNSIAVDAQGNAYVTGYAKSTDFPTTANAIQTERKGNDDAFITKLASDGKTALFSTYLGGDAGDDGLAIAVDDLGYPYFYGSISAGFPIGSGPFETGRFIGKLHPDGSGFIYSLRVPAYGYSMAVDDLAQVYIGGSMNGDAQVFVLNAEGSDSLYTITFGGSDSEFLADIALDDEGNLYATGTTKSLDFPVNNAYQSAYGDDTTGFIKSDAFIVKLNLAVEEKQNLEVSPNPVVFPLTFPGETSRETVTVTNPSEEDIEIQNIEVEPTTMFALENDPDLPITLKSNEEVEFQIAYAPEGFNKSSKSETSGGTGALVIVNNGETPVLSVPLWATGIIVNDAGDASDYDLQDGICDSDPDEPGNQCTLRAAIENVNNNQDNDVTTVYIRIPGEGGAEIIPSSPLPSILYPIHFDVPIDDGLLLLNGEQAGQGDGLDIRSGHCLVENMIFTKWKWNGIKIRGGEWNYVDNCIFIDNNTEDIWPEVAGIHIDESASNQIRNCVIFGNLGSGILVSGTSSQMNVIEDSYIGIDRNFSPGSGRQKTGIKLSYGSDTKIRRNSIAHNRSAGIKIQNAAKTLIEDNRVDFNKEVGIHLTDASNETEIRNNSIESNKGDILTGYKTGDGIRLYGRVSNTHIHDNLISHNKNAGISATGTLASPVRDMLIENNTIGLNSMGTAASGNRFGIQLRFNCLNNVIQNNTISANKECDILVESVGNNYNEILDNMIGTDPEGKKVFLSAYYWYGIKMDNSSSFFMAGNTISGHTKAQVGITNGKTGKNYFFYNNIGTDKDGAALNEIGNTRSGVGFMSSNAAIEMAGNQFAYLATGIIFDKESVGICADNDINNNTLGLYINGESAINVLMNRIYENSDGVKVEDLEKEQAIIAGNEIYNNTDVKTGIHFINGAAKMIGNSIYGDAGNGIAVEGDILPRIRNNNILDNGGLGLIYKGSAGPVDAIYNWWGEADGPGSSGPGTGDGVSAGIDYSPWRDSPVALFLVAESDTIYMPIKYETWAEVYFQNWTNPRDTIIYQIQLDQPWLKSPDESEDTVYMYDWFLATDWIEFQVPEGTAPGAMAHVEVSAVSLADGSRDTARFVAITRGYDPASMHIIPDSITLNARDSFQFSASGVDQDFWEVYIEPLWQCTGGKVDPSGTFVAGNETGEYSITVTDTLSGLSAQARVIIMAEGTSVPETPVINSFPVELFQNFPNPFNEYTQFQYTINRPTRVRIAIYDIMGREIRTFVDRMHPPGDYSLTWNGTDHSNRKVAEGIYFYQIRTPDHSKSLKMFLIR